MQRKTIRKGYQGSEVAHLHELLKWYGIWPPLGGEGSHDPKIAQGVEREAGERFFGPITHACVLDFQSRHLDSLGNPLVPDGIVGPLTWWSLANLKVAIEPASEFEVPDGGSESGRAALKLALEQMRLGAGELNANNDGMWVEKYINGLVALPANWCAGFVSWCFYQAMQEPPFKYSLGARDLRQQMKRRGLTYDLKEDGVTPEPGDLAFWWRGRKTGWQGHTGIVFQSSDGILQVVEGNKGSFPSKVGVFSYVQSRMTRFLGFARIP